MKLKLIAGLALALVLAACDSGSGRASSPAASLAPVSAPAPKGCSAAGFEIVSHNARRDDSGFLDDDMIVSASVKNNNPVACAAKIEVEVRDSAGKVMGTASGWTGSENFAPGDTRNADVIVPKALAALGPAYGVRAVESVIW